jgi:hypothetical protein
MRSCSIGRCAGLCALTLLGAALAGCLSTRVSPAAALPSPRDLTPVTWLATPSHAPVALVR